MKFESKIYKSVDIMPEILSQLIDDYHFEAGYGYFLVDDKLVPKSLVKRLFNHLCESVFEYGQTFSVKELVGDEFWLSLDENEKSVIGPCLLIVIENGFSIPIPDDLLTEH